MRRFGEDNALPYREEVATAVLNRVLLLDLLDRPEEALEACDEALRRFGSTDEAHVVQCAAQTLVCKGALLVALDRAEEGLAAWDEVVRRFETSDVLQLRGAAESALRRRAQHELTKGCTRIALGLLDRALAQARAGIPESRLQAILVRARAHLGEGNGAVCSRDVETALSILSELNTLPRDVLEALADLASGVGLARMCDLIKSSPARDLLLPLTTALERELGLEPRVPREVEEIAEDIRREMFIRPADRADRPTP